MRRLVFCLGVAHVLALSVLLHATIFGRIQGGVADPQNLPVVGATVKLQATTSDWSQTTQTDEKGQFMFPAVPVGDYKVTVSQTGFQSLEQTLTVEAGTSPTLKFQLAIAQASQSTTVAAAAPEMVPVESVTPTTLVDRQDISQTPGANLTNSMAMITDFTPGAYMAHDMLHVRGGHQVNWLIDGVPIPNTNIATNLGPQIDPKDIDYLDVERGSYGADYGDRTYGIFNIVPRSGFESDNEGELITSFGNYYQTNDQLDFASHTDRFAYYTSVTANRSDYGLEPPVEQTVHGAENGVGGFVSLIFDENANNQFRLDADLRRDYYQIPIDPNPNSPGNQIYPSYGLHDAESEPDGYATFSWVHTFSNNVRTTVSPFYHYNAADYQGSPNDVPVISDVDQKANYAGLQATVDAVLPHGNELQAGVYGFVQHQSMYFDNIFTDCGTSCTNFAPSTDALTGGLVDEFVNDSFKINSWVTLTGGLRESQFTSPLITENATDPRVGAMVKIPFLHWIFRGFFGDYYQAPPLLTATGPLQNLATSQSLTFTPLKGERDQEHQFGITIPIRGWQIDADTFLTLATNWLDHSNIGESNIFWPLTWAGAFIKGNELTVRSPRIWKSSQVHLSYSNQVAESTAPFTGGLICPSPAPPGCEPPPGFNPVDHDQRNTVNVGFDATLPWQAFFSTNVYYGSGLTNGMPDAQYPNGHLPYNATVGISLGKSFSEGKYRLTLNALNVANYRVLVDDSLTFGGFHYNDPRQIYAEFRWKFHY